MNRWLLALALAAPASAADSTPPPAEDYALHCSGCHGRDGAGVPGTTPSLREVGALLDRPGGRAYLVRVPGVAQAPLDDARLARLLGWVLREHAGRAPEPAYTAQEVGALRRLPLRDAVAARERLGEPE